MYKKAIRKTRRLKGNKIFGTFIPTEANYLVFFMGFKTSKKDFSNKNIEIYAISPHFQNWHGSC